MRIDAQSILQKDEIGTTILKSLMSHRIKFFLNMPQQAHNFYISLQSTKQFCNEALSWLSPTFIISGPYTQLLERLIVLMAKKLDFPNKIIIVKEGLEIVKELISFFLVNY